MIKKIVLSCSLVVLSVSSLLATYPTLSAMLGHHVAYSLTTGGIYDIKGKSLGILEQMGVAYELNKNNFFADFGINIDYTLKFSSIDSMRDIHDRIDRDGERVLYNYVYNHFREKQHTIMFSIPIQVGFDFEYCYLSWGIKVGIPIIGKYISTTNLYTEGILCTYGTDQSTIQPVSQNVPKHGYYPSATYSYTGNYHMGALFVSTNIELGRTFIITKKVACRFGGFIEFGIHLNTASKNFLIDYSSVNLNTETQTQQNLKDNLKFNAIVNSRNNLTLQRGGGEELIKGFVENIQVGLRCTFLFQVIRNKAFCHCR